MTLGQAQRQFTFMVGKLIVWAYEHGYEFSFGEAFRTDEQSEINAMGTVGRQKLAEILRCDQYHVLAEKIENNTGSGIRGSLHEIRLAIDLNLFKDGVYQTDGEAHTPLHDYWDLIGGAERISKDMNHYSFAWRGKL